MTDKKEFEMNNEEDNNDIESNPMNSKEEQDAIVPKSIDEEIEWIKNKGFSLIDPEQFHNSIMSEDFEASSKLFNSISFIWGLPMQRKPYLITKDMVLGYKYMMNAIPSEDLNIKKRLVFRGCHGSGKSTTIEVLRGMCYYKSIPVFGDYDIEKLVSSKNKDKHTVKMYEDRCRENLKYLNNIPDHLKDLFQKWLDEDLKKMSFFTFFNHEISEANIPKSVFFYDNILEASPNSSLMSDFYVTQIATGARPPKGSLVVAAEFNDPTEGKLPIESSFPLEPLSGKQLDCFIDYALFKMNLEDRNLGDKIKSYVSLITPFPGRVALMIYSLAMDPSLSVEQYIKDMIDWERQRASKIFKNYAQGHYRKSLMEFDTNTFLGELCDSIFNNLVLKKKESDGPFRSLLLKSNLAYIDYKTNNAVPMTYGIIDESLKFLQEMDISNKYNTRSSRYRNLKSMFYHSKKQEIRYEAQVHELLRRALVSISKEFNIVTRDPNTHDVVENLSIPIKRPFRFLPLDRRDKSLDDYQEILKKDMPGTTFFVSEHGNFAPYDLIIVSENGVYKFKMCRFVSEKTHVSIHTNWFAPKTYTKPVHIILTPMVRICNPENELRMSPYFGGHNKDNVNEPKIGISFFADWMNDFSELLQRFLQQKRREKAEIRAAVMKESTFSVDEIERMMNSGLEKLGSNAVEELITKFTDKKPEVNVHNTQSSFAKAKMGATADGDRNEWISKQKADEDQREKLVKRFGENHVQKMEEIDREREEARNEDYKKFRLDPIVNPKKKKGPKFKKNTGLDAALGKAMATSNLDFEQTLKGTGKGNNEKPIHKINWDKK